MNHLKEPNCMVKYQIYWPTFSKQPVSQKNMNVSKCCQVEIITRPNPNPHKPNNVS